MATTHPVHFIWPEMPTRLIKPVLHVEDGIFYLNRPEKIQEKDDSLQKYIIHSTTFLEAFRFGCRKVGTSTHMKAN